MDTTTSPNASSPIASRRYGGFGVLLAVSAAIWLTTVSVGVAQAEGPPQVQTKSQEVSFDDLNLTSESGARTLLVRITRAARTACGPITHSPLLPREAANHRACVADAVDAAVRHVDLPVLTALHSGAAADIVIAAR
jgi:UrcA family protein